LSRGYLKKIKNIFSGEQQQQKEVKPQNEVKPLLPLFGRPPAEFHFFKIS
jgi:hypothetical protein